MVDRNVLPIECRITFTWPSSITREQFDNLRHDDARTYFIQELKRSIYNDLPNIVAELIAEERYEVSVVEVTR
jgi:hypothetical protein